MSNYTKTTNFATKDALASGNPAKIVKGTEIDTEFNNIAVASSTKANKADPVFTGTATLPVTNASSLSIGGDGVTVTGIKDEDDMASNSATKLASQQSIKAYVDSQVTAQDLDVTDGTNTIAIDLDSEALSLLGGTGVTSTASGNGVTLAIDSTVATLTGTQTLSNKTLATPVISGNLTTDGTIDGRDVAADGNKLDGIEALADVTDTANVTAAGALMDSELTNITAVKALDQGVATTDSPTFVGINSAAFSIKNADGDENMAVFTEDGGVKLYYNNAMRIHTLVTGNYLVGTTILDGLQVDGDIVANGGIALGDNDKATFGAGDDLQIYHTGAKSLISDTGAGYLELQTNGGEVQITGNSGAQYMAQFVSEGAVLLYNNGSPKLATTATGIDVTGTATMDGLTVDGAIAFDSTIDGVINAPYSVFVNIDTLNNSSGDVFQIGRDATGTGAAKVFTAKENGDISFYEDTGTTPKFFWDASAESLGVGTSSPSSSYSIDAAKGIRSSGTAPNFTLQETDASNQTWLMASYGGDFAIRDTTVAGTAYPFKIEAATPSNTLYLDSTGSVGIGTDSPSDVLHVKATADTSGAPIVGLSPTATNNIQGGLGCLAGGELQVIGTNLSTFYTAGSERMRIDSSGNVGIGESSPDQKLHVSQAINNGFATVKIENSFGAGSVVGTGAALQFSGWDAGVSANIKSVRTGLSYSPSALTFETFGGAGTTGSNTLAERMRIDEFGNMGIGTSSPAVKFHTTSGVARVNTAKTETAFFATDDADDYRFGLAISHKGGATDADRYASLDSASYRISTDTFSAGGSLVLQELGGNVGIGTSSPTDALVVEGNVASPHRIKVSNANASGKAALNFTQGTTVKSWLEFDNASGIFDVWQYTNNDLRFGTNNTERMRIDASGNLLVGKSGTGYLNQGVEARANGVVIATAASTEPLSINRKTNDGAVIGLYKDGTAVGSIGTHSGGGTYFYSNSGSDSGLTFWSNVVAPSTSSGGFRDAVTDLGASGGRFKDLYLSGGVYLGGTGAANKLDDYEQGTFTATINGSTEPASLLTRAGYYTKVGEKVHFQIAFENIDTTGYAGDLSITGLPFTARTLRAVVNVVHYNTTTWSTSQVPIAIIGAGATSIQFLNQLSGASWTVNQHNAGAGRYLWITGTYITAA